MLPSRLLESKDYPKHRLRRTRKYPWSRHMVAETTLTPHDLILPIFVRENNIDENISSMPGVYRHSLDQVTTIAQEAYDLGIPAIALFPVVDRKKRSHRGEEALNEGGLLPQAIALIRKNCPELGIISDPALDAYTSHGHDGVLDLDGHDVDNDQTLEMLCAHGLIQAKAGAQILAPSDMMDGRVGALRRVLDHEGFSHVMIMSYSAKYASAYYGPFRDALQSAQCLGIKDKKTYQMDYRNGQEALREVAQDIQEGADMVMVKPGLPYLDVIKEISQTFDIPTFAFHVSGEYASLKSSAMAGYMDYDRALMESLTAFKRAGASGILTYGAIDCARILKNTSEQS
jgi:porphobilinogen synthase